MSPSVRAFSELPAARSRPPRLEYSAVVCGQSWNLQVCRHDHLTTMISPPKLTQRPSRAERAQNRGSAYSSGSDTSTDGSRPMESDMRPPVKRPRYSRRCGGNAGAEQETNAILIDSPFDGAATTSAIVRRAPPPKMSYEKDAKQRTVEEALPQVQNSAVALDELFSTTKATSLPPRKSVVSASLTAPASNTENTAPSSPLSSTPSPQSSRSSTIALPQAPPLITIEHASPSKETVLPSPALSPHPEMISAPVVAMLAPPSISTRSEWSKRKVEGKPGLRVVGKMTAVVTRKQTAAEKLAAANAAAKKEKEEAKVQAHTIAERFTRISLSVIIHNDPFATVSVSHSSSRFPIHPSRAERSPTRTSLLYTFNHTDTSILSIKLASNVIRVPDEISAPYLEEETARSEWVLEISDGRAAWKV